MPVFSTGGMRYQQDWADLPLEKIEAARQENLRATIQTSLDHGINHIETARGYGSSERQLGVVLPTYPREQLIVQTKVGPNEDLEQFRAHVHESLERLQLDRIDLLGIHGINHPATLDNALGKDRRSGCLAVARQLQREGKVGHVGFSTHGPLDVLLEAINAPGPDGNGLDYINVHWYFIFQRNRAAIEAAVARDMGVFIISPTDKGGHLHTPSDTLCELCAPLHPIVFNDLWCLMHDVPHTLSLGASKPSDYDLHVEAAALLGQPGVDEQVRQIAQRLGDAMQRATGHADPEHRVWELPDHRTAPGKLNVPIILWLLNLAKGWGAAGIRQGAV